MSDCESGWVPKRHEGSKEGPNSLQLSSLKIKVDQVGLTNYPTVLCFQGRWHARRPFNYKIRRHGTLVSRSEMAGRIAHFDFQNPSSKDLTHARHQKLKRQAKVNSTPGQQLPNVSTRVPRKGDYSTLQTARQCVLIKGLHASSCDRV